LPQVQHRPKALEEFAEQHHLVVQEQKLELVLALVQQQVLLLQQVEQK
jgi:hypothetical protein